MSIFTIENKIFDIPENNVNILNDIPDSLYGRALKRVRSYMHSIEHNPGETIEDVFNILIEYEKQANIDELVEKGEKAIDEKYAESLAKIENKIKEETVKHYEDKAKESQEKKLKVLSDSFGDKWKMAPDEARNAVFEALLGKDYAKTKSKDMQDAFLTKVAQGLKDFDEKDINGDPDFLEKAGKYKEQAKAVLEYASTKKEIESKDVIDRYVNYNVKTDPDNFYKNNLENSYEYSKIKDEIKTAKEPLRQEAIQKLNKGIGVKESLMDLENGKEVYLREKQEKKENFKEVIEERNSLVNRYQSTNIFSRIARWVLPNSWSEAGRIQNEIDKLDKAVKDAGYKKEDVEAFQKEMLEDSQKSNAEVEIVKPEKVSVKGKDEETIDIQNALNKDTGSKDIESSEKIIENKEVGSKEIVQ